MEKRVAVLRQLPREVPHGVQSFKGLYGVSGDLDEFAALAEFCPVFEAAPLSEQTGQTLTNTNHENR